MNRMKAMLVLVVMLFAMFSTIYTKDVRNLGVGIPCEDIDKIKYAIGGDDLSTTRSDIFYALGKDSYNDFHYNGIWKYKNLLINGTGTDAKLELSPDYEWVDITPQQIPTTRYGHGMAYDPSLGIAVLFGGNHYQNGNNYLNDTWIYDIKNNTWTQKFPALSPSTRSHPAMVYDPLNSAVVLFGGVQGNTHFNDTWIYHIYNNTWIEMSPNVQPPKRGYAAITYNQWNDTVMLFGGQKKWRYKDTWFYDTAQNNWTEMKPKANPREGSRISMCYDEKNDKIIMFGGDQTSNDTWVYDPHLNNWTEMFPFTHPPARDSYCLEYSVGNLSGVFLFGGRNGSTYYNDNWLYNYTSNNWTQLTPGFISLKAREGASMIYHRDSDEFFLYGGRQKSQYRCHSDIHKLTFKSYNLRSSGYFQSWNTSKGEGKWHTLFVKKYEPPGTYINISLCNYETSAPVPGFENLSEANIDLEPINDMNMSGYFYIEGWFSSKGNISPALDSWSVKLLPKRVWQDSFYNQNKIAHKTNVKIEYKAEMDNLSHKTAYLDSENITLPNSLSWNCLVVEKTEPENTSLNVTLINAKTGNPINGFVNINLSGKTDLTSLDPHQHDSIILNATFLGNGTNTPVLKRWGVGWMNTAPKIGSLTGFQNVNRTETIVISAPVSDKEDSNDKLKMKVLHRKYGDRGNFKYSHNTGTYANATHLFCNFTPAANARIGSYDILISVVDAGGLVSYSQKYKNAFKVNNYLPRYNNISLSNGVINWKSNCTITLVNITEEETAIHNLSIFVFHRKGHNGNWDSSLVSSLGFSGINYSVKFTPDGKSSIGIYDFRITLVDNDDNAEYIHNNLISVVNKPPKFNGMTESRSTFNWTANSSISILNISDEESNINNLTVSLEHRLTGTAPWSSSCVSDIGWEGSNYSFVFQLKPQAFVGVYDLKAVVFDGINRTEQIFPRKLNVTNNPASYDSIIVKKPVFNWTSNTTITFVNVTDEETPFYDLNITVLQRLNATQNWNESYISHIGWNENNYTVRFTPGPNASLGRYDIKVKIDDVKNITKKSYKNTITVTNSHPALDYVSISSSIVYRTNKSRISIFNISDEESPINDINISVSYRLNGTQQWQNNYLQFIEWQGDDLILDFIPNSSARIGLYDIRIILNDSKNSTELYYYNEIRVKNNLPGFQYLDISEAEIFRSSNSILTISDFIEIETALDDTVILVEYRLNGTFDWHDNWISRLDSKSVNISFQFNPDFFADLGFYDFMVTLDDGDNISKFEFPNAIFVKNNLPTMKGIEPVTEAINRSKTLDITLIDINDVETSWQHLDISVFYRLNGKMEWNITGIFLVRSRSGNITAKFIPKINATLGMYDLKVLLNDSLNTTQWIYPNFVNVVNNYPTLPEIITSPIEIFRTEKFEMILSRTHDTETSNVDLNISIWIRDNGTGNWTDLDVKLSDILGFDMVFENTQSRNVILGWKDIRVSIFDGDDITFFEFYKVFKVINLPPSISENLSTMKLIENQRRTFSLLEWSGDEKDLTSTLKWEYELSTVNLDLIDWIRISGYNVTVRPMNGKIGSNNVKFTVRDSDGGITSKYIEIDIFKTDEKLVTSLRSPVNNYVLRTRTVNLTWEATYTDTDNPVFYDIYLGNDQNSILESNSSHLIGTTSNRYFIADDLTRNHERYYWSVIPRNSSSMGYCIQGFSCIYTDFNNPPIVDLRSPKNGSVLIHTSGKLRWSSQDQDKDYLGFMIYISLSRVNVEKRDPNSLLAITNLKTYPLPPLRINEIYYWTVIPYDGISFGNCNSEIWSFSVDVGNLKIPSVDFSSSARRLLTGETARFTINPGETDNEISFRLDFGDGNYSKWSKQKIMAHKYMNPGIHSVRLSVLVDNVEVLLSGIIEIEVTDISSIEIGFSEIEKTEENTVILNGNITGVNWISQNLSVMLTINGNEIPIFTEKNWSMMIEQSMLVEGQNNFSVCLNFKGSAIKAINTTLEMKFTKEVKSTAGLYIGIGSAVLVLILIAVLFLIFIILPRRKREQEEKQETEILLHEKAKDDAPEIPIIEAALEPEPAVSPSINVDTRVIETIPIPMDLDDSTLLCPACGTSVQYYPEYECHWCDTCQDYVYTNEGNQEEFSPEPQLSWDPEVKLPTPEDDLSAPPPEEDNNDIEELLQDDLLPQDNEKKEKIIAEYTETKEMLEKAPPYIDTSIPLEILERARFDLDNDEIDNAGKAIEEIKDMIMETRLRYGKLVEKSGLILLKLQEFQDLNLDTSGIVEQFTKGKEALMKGAFASCDDIFENIIGEIENKEEESSDKIEVRTDHTDSTENENDDINPPDVQKEDESTVSLEEPFEDTREKSLGLDSDSTLENIIDEKESKDEQKKEDADVKDDSLENILDDLDSFFD